MRYIVRDVPNAQTSAVGRYSIIEAFHKHPEKVRIWRQGVWILSEKALELARAAYPAYDWVVVGEVE